MSKDWYYSEGNQNYKKWFRSTNQRIECPLGKYPIIRADIDECITRDGEDPVFTRLGTVEIDSTNLNTEEAEMAATVQTFFTELIVKHATQLIENRLNGQGTII